MNLDLQTLIRVNPKAETITIWDNTIVGSTYGWQPAAGGVPTANPKKSEVTLGSYIIAYPNNGLSFSGNFTAQQLANYLDPTQGVTLSAYTLFGVPYYNFPDGIPTITVTLHGATIAGVSSPWSAYIATRTAFIIFTQNIIRTWALQIPNTTNDLRSVFDPAMANLLLDGIYYNVAFGQYDEAQRVLDFLIELTTAGKNITDYLNEHNL